MFVLLDGWRPTKRNETNYYRAQVRSVALDEWTLPQIAVMREIGVLSVVVVVVVVVHC
jgi:hypothetical protein